jgi:hypothetical protein
MGSIPGMTSSGTWSPAFQSIMSGGAVGGGSSMAAQFAAAGMMSGPMGSGPAGPGAAGAASSIIGSIPGLSKSFGSAAMTGAMNPIATLGAWASGSDSVSTGAGSATSMDALGVAGKIGAVGALAAAGFGIYSGVQDFSKGGAYGDLAGIGKIAGSIAAVDPEPISKAVLGSIAAVTTVVTAIMGDPRMQRATEEARTLKYAHYFDPVAINETESTGGTYADQGRGGFVRNSPFSPVPTVQQSFADWRNNTIIPGRTTSQFSTQATNTNNFTIQAIDSQSVAQFTSKYSDSLADGIVKAVGAGHSIVPQMRDAMNGG